MSIAIFFFAHQDDEFGVFNQIEQELISGKKVVCIFVTDGGAKQTLRRNSESTAVLKILGVLPENIYFLGGDLDIPDCQLHLRINIFIKWLDSFIIKFNPSFIYIPAWEGGHPDHDVLHAVIVKFFENKTNFKFIKQYSLYNNFKCSGPLFKVLSPIPQNGEIFISRIKLKDRIRYLKLCLFYRSQWKSWLGLFPAVLIHYFLFGVQNLQPVKLARIYEKPHEGILYYEYRKFLDWDTLKNHL